MVPNVATNDRYIGGVLIPDGRVIFVPYSATNIGIYDPDGNNGTGSFSQCPVISPSGANKYAGGVLLSDGRVLFIPYDASKIGIYDPTDDSFVTFGSGLGATNKYFGGSLLADGTVVMAPHQSTTIGIVSGFSLADTAMCTHPLL